MVAMMGMRTGARLMLVLFNSERGGNVKRALRIGMDSRFIDEM